MKCPICNSWTDTIDTRKKPEGVVRRRKCGNEHTFSTIEIVYRRKEMQVDKNISLPAKYPFAQMQVGDSFRVPDGVSRTTISVAAKRFGDKNKMKFTVRLTEDRSLRCWRVA